MQFSAFSISRLPRIYFGSGRITELPALAAGFGRQALLITGKHSFCDTPRWSSLIQGLEARAMGWAHITVSGEPSPMLVDEVVSRFRGQAIDVPEYALIDPDLLTTCPPELTAADGMDAFTQLLESYLSIKANPFIDALAWSGMGAVKQGLFAAWAGKEPEAALN